MDLANLPKLGVTFAAPFPEPHLTIIFNPPFPDVNPIFAAVARSRIRPYALAIEQGAVSEETATHIYAEAYAEGAIDRSPTEGFESMTIEQWKQWLLSHPDHFEEIRSLIDCRSNWKLPKEAHDGDGPRLPR